MKKTIVFDQDCNINKGKMILDPCLTPIKDNHACSGKCKKELCREWSFYSPHKASIDYDLIMKELSYKNPIAIGNREGCKDYRIFIHSSIFKKAMTCKMPFPKITNNSFWCKDLSILNSWIEWVKNVKKEKWPSIFKGKVTITIPII
jgi:hypothetical protein